MVTENEIPDEFDTDETLSKQASKLLVHNTEGGVDELPVFRNAGRIRTTQNGNRIKVLVPLPFVHISDLTYKRLEGLLNALNSEYIEVEVAPCPET